MTETNTPATPTPPDTAHSHGSLVIIGGGPAGLIAAEIAGAAGIGVTLYERMPTVGRKFLMAGRGGLNLTHSEEREPFLARYREAASWLRPRIDAFPPDRLRG